MMPRFSQDITRFGNYCRRRYLVETRAARVLPQDLRLLNEDDSRFMRQIYEAGFDMEAAYRRQLQVESDSYFEVRQHIMTLLQVWDAIIDENDLWDTAGQPKRSRNFKRAFLIGRQLIPERVKIGSFGFDSRHFMARADSLSTIASQPESLIEEPVQRQGPVQHLSPGTLPESGPVAPYQGSDVISISSDEGYAAFGASPSPLVLDEQDSVDLDHDSLSRDVEDEGRGSCFDDIPLEEHDLEELFMADESDLKDNHVPCKTPWGVGQAQFQIEAEPEYRLPSDGPSKKRKRTDEDDEDGPKRSKRRLNEQPLPVRDRDSDGRSGDSVGPEAIARSCRYRLVDDTSSQVEVLETSLSLPNCSQ